MQEGTSVDSISVDNSEPRRGEVDRYTLFDESDIGIADVPEAVLDAMVQCASLWGLKRTRIDDVARFAGMSRASIYRHVPGGKEQLIRYAGVREALDILDGVVAAFAAGETLEAQLENGLLAAARATHAHPALQYLVAHEPESLMPYFAFDRLDGTLLRVSEACGPALSRFVDKNTAGELAEWCARLVLQDLFHPDDITLEDPESVRRLVRTYIAPGARCAAALSAGSPLDTSATANPPTPDMPQGGLQ